jgi:homoserine O-succinyltransferase/O-acetyltransferase
MTLVTNPHQYPKFARRLDEAAIPHIDEAQAAQQDIYPLDVGLANLMPAPAMKATELQWFRWFGNHALLQIRPHFVKFDDDQRERSEASRAAILKRYTPLSEIADRGLHTLIVTGDNVETRDVNMAAGREPIKLEEITYKQKLDGLIEFSETVPVTIFSCLAAHYALHRIHGLDRKILDLDKKISGVYQHEVTAPDSPLMRGMGDVVVSPHSRWGDISAEEVAKVPTLKLLAISSVVGWLALEERLPNGNLRIYLQGHPEYDKNDLDSEYKRDRSKDPQTATLPANYYPSDDCSKTPECNWPPYARVLHENILGETYKIAEARRQA